MNRISLLAKKLWRLTHPREARLRDEYEAKLEQGATAIKQQVTNIAQAVRPGIEERLRITSDPNSTPDEFRRALQEHCAAMNEMWSNFSDLGLGSDPSDIYPRSEYKLPLHEIWFDRGKEFERTVFVHPNFTLDLLQDLNLVTLDRNGTWAEELLRRPNLIDLVEQNQTFVEALDASAQSCLVKAALRYDILPQTVINALLHVSNPLLRLKVETHQFRS